VDCWRSYRLGDEPQGSFGTIASFSIQIFRDSRSRSSLLVQGLQGLWAGIVIGYVVTTVLALSALYVGNWDKIAVEVAERAKKEKADEEARHGHGYANPLRAVYDSDGTVVDFRLPSSSGLASPAPTSRLLSPTKLREFELSEVSLASPHPFAPKK
jgi:hypothetical protein